MVRLKHRYLLFEILYPTKDANANATKPVLDVTDTFMQFHAPSPPQLDEKLLSRIIRENVRDLFGDYGTGKVFGSIKSGLTLNGDHFTTDQLIPSTVVYFSNATSTGIVRVSRDHVNMVWAAMSFTKKFFKPLSDTTCVFHVVRSSGTIRLAEEEAIKRAKLFVRRARDSKQGADLDHLLKKAVAVEARENTASNMDVDDASDEV